MRYSGSAALDLAYVASGRYDGYFHNKINIWDVAAGALMVKEAGGIVNDLNKFSSNNINIRASSSAINDKMLEKLRTFNCVLKFFCYKSRYEKSIHPNYHTIKWK